MKRVMALILGLSMMLGIAACSKKVEVPSKKDARNAAEEEYDMDFKFESEDISKDEKEAEWVFISKDGSLEVTVTWNAKNPDEFEFEEEEIPVATETDPVIVTTPVETTDETLTPAETSEETLTPAETSEETTKAPSVVSGTIVNFDEMNFYINGKKYTLGKTTLQDLIDDDVPFNKSDIEDANNNLKSHYQSSGFKIELAEYYSAQVYVMNDSDEGMPMNECVVCEIYIPVNKDIEQDVLKLDFPLTLTMAELEASAGLPEDGVEHYEDEDSDYYSDTYKYSIESEKYYGGSSYDFEFVNGEIRYIYINWMP